jgi:hypothetical protein
MEKNLTRKNYWCYICEIKIELSDAEEMSCPKCHSNVIEEMNNENKEKIDFIPPRRELKSFFKSRRNIPITK